jgi:anti-anti-sigma regulatory factor
MSAEAKSPKTPAAKSNGGSPGNGNSASASVPSSAPATVVAIKGSLDRGLDHVDKVLASKVDLVLDFSECTFVTVDGLEWLEELLLRAESLQSNVRLVKMHPTVYKVFKVAHIRSLLKACDSPAPRGPVC